MPREKHATAEPPPTPPQYKTLDTLKILHSREKEKVYKVVPCSSGVFHNSQDFPIT